MRRLLLPVCGIYACALAPLMAQEADTAAAGPVDTVVTNQLFHGELVLRLGGGVVSYGEDASIDDVESDFDAGVAVFGARYTYSDPAGFKLRGTIAGWVSDTDDEEWEEAGQLLQRNELQTGGWDVDGAFGLDLLRASPEELNLWLGLGYRTQFFERSQFQSVGLDGVRESDIGTVDEDYLLGRFTVGVDSAIDLAPAWTLAGEATYGYIFFNEADNEVLGTIDGDGGHSIDLAATLAYAVSEISSVGASVRYALQELDGDVEQGVVLTPAGAFQQVSEWPDNELEWVSIDIFWMRAL